MKTYSVVTLSAASFALLGLSTTALIGAFSYSISRNRTTAAVERESALMLETNLRSFESQFNLAERVLTDFERYSGLELDSGPAGEILRGYAGLLDGAKYLAAARGDGKAVFSDGRAPPPSFDPRRQRWYEGAEPDASWQDLHLDYFDQEIVISVSRSFGDQPGAVRAAAVFSVRGLGAEFAAGFAGANGTTLLLDSAGKVIADRENRYLGKVIPLSREDLGRDKAKVRFALDGRSFFGYLGKLPRNDMAVLAAASEDELERSIAQDFAAAFGIGFCCVALFCAVAVALTRKASRPLVDLAESMRRAQDGDYSISLSFGQYHEVLELSRDFNSMLASIRERDEALRERESRIKNLAYFDSLTGLPNRAQILRLIGEELAKDGGKPASGALLYLDLDRFKIVNDTLGHSAGDLVLVEVAERLKANLRPGQIAARLGGDEFLAFLPGVRSAETVARIAGRIVEALRVPFEIRGVRFDTGASIGAVLYPPHGTDTETLVAKADKAMYEAKSNGRSGFVVYGEGLRP